MRDYALFLAGQSLQLSGGGLLRQMIENWRARRQVHQIAALDDFMLRDIGLSRLDVDAAALLPLSRNAIAELELVAHRKTPFGLPGQNSSFVPS